MVLFPVIYIILVDSKVHATFQQNMTILFIVGSILPNDLCMGWSKVWSKGSDEIPSLYLDRAIYAEGRSGLLKAYGLKDAYISDHILRRPG